MNISLRGLFALLVVIFSSTVFAGEVIGTGSTIPVALIKAWGDAYSMHFPASVIKYKGSSPADGIKRLESGEVDFSSIDMPLDVSDLAKNGLAQFPFALGAVTPVVNLPNVYAGQLRLDGETLGDIFLGNIKKWNDPAIAALNPNIQLPDVSIITIHRVSPPGLKTILGDFLAKTNPQWKSIKGDMGGSWPATAIEVKDPIENLAMIKKTQYSIGYGPISMALKNNLAYIKLKNSAGNFVSPSDENISAAAVNAKWDESNGFGVVLTNQPGAFSWPMSMASFALVRKSSEQPERIKEVLKYFKYSLRYGELNAVLHDYIPLPDVVTSVVESSWVNIVGAKGVPVQ